MKNFITEIIGFQGGGGITVDKKRFFLGMSLSNL